MILTSYPILGVFAQYLTQTSRLASSFLFGLLIFGFSLPAQGQTTGTAPSPDSLWTIELPIMVVTATRSEIALRDVPVPTKVLLAEQIKKRGVLRLSDLLAEEPGMLQVHYFGSGIQLQGFDAEYTLILIDGQPVIGRNGGTLDLDRFAVSDIESVEIVQGPSSSLYGSEALAGVINLRTREANLPWAASTGYRVQTNGTRNATLSAERAGKRLGIRLNYDRFASNGYDLSPDVIGLTGPGFVTHTLTNRISQKWSPTLSSSLSARFASQNQSNVIGFDQSGVELSFDERLNQDDFSFSPELTWKPMGAHRVTIRSHITGFDTRTILVDQEGTSSIQFSQGYQKMEAQHDLILASGLIMNTGAGVIYEQVTADRISGGTRSNSTTYAFTQQQWFLHPTLQLNSSARLDYHTDYGTRFTPKAAVMYKAANSLRLRASVGSGFKAPSFQQLYMDFTNAVAGYSVVGAADVTSALNDLESLGQIQTFLSDPSSFSAILPESSWAFNVSTDFDVTSRLHAHISLFRNNVQDLIETLPVAAKPNGQQVFTYVNLSRIFTQGLTTEIRIKPLAQVSLSLGYQYLDAKDRTVLADIADGRVYGRKGGRDFRLTRSDYGGLFNRSRHSGSLQVAWNSKDDRSSVRLRGSFRSRYGYGDQNGNLILDADTEYVAGFSTWNATFNHDFGTRLTLQTGVNNMWGYTNPQFVPSLSGRQFFVGLQFSTH